MVRAREARTLMEISLAFTTVLFKRYYSRLGSSCLAVPRVFRVCVSN